MVYNWLMTEVEGGLVSTGCKGGKNFGEGSNHSSIVLGGHSRNKDDIEVIDVCQKYVLHGFERVDGEHAREVSAVLRLARVAKQNISWAAQILQSAGDC
jgi:hypothetical protein